MYMFACNNKLKKKEKTLTKHEIEVINIGHLEFSISSNYVELTVNLE